MLCRAALLLLQLMRLPDVYTTGAANFNAQERNLLELRLAIHARVKVVSRGTDASLMRLREIDILYDFDNTIIGVNKYNRTMLE